MYCTCAVHVLYMYCTCTVHVLYMCCTCADMCCTCAVHVSACIVTCTSGESVCITSLPQFPGGVDQCEARKLLKCFEELILDKQFLLTMVHTWESQSGRFTMKDRLVWPPVC